jgi:hypothetical protein
MGGSSNENQSNLNNVPLTPEDIMSFVVDATPIITSGKPRSEQLVMLFGLLFKYLNGSP